MNGLTVLAEAAVTIVAIAALSLLLYWISGLITRGKP